MDFNSAIVTAVIFAPLLGALVLAAIPNTEKGQLKAATLVTMFVSFGLSLVMYLAYVPRSQGGRDFQLEYTHAWVESLGLSYHVGVDGVAATLMLLTGFLGPIVVMAAWNNAKERAKEFCVALLVLQTAMMGTFAAMDLVLFYVFYEGVLIPMYLLIGIFGSDNREYASIKFFLYTMVGSMPMLVGILYLYAQTSVGGDHHSFDLGAMMVAGAKLNGTPAQMWLFAAFALAFAVKVPMWPLHTWLPDAHTEAPAAGSMILAGVMLKMGTFGFMRYAMPLFPVAAQHAAPLLGILAVVGIVYGALMSLTQTDMKKLVAYSSVSHLGFVMLGLSSLSPTASTGAVYQMVNHGISTGALFLLIGAIYERRHTRLLADYGGIAKVVPMFTVAFLIITFSSVALPGTNGFIGEFLILSGTFTTGRVFQGTMFGGMPAAWAVVGGVGALGVIFGAAYMLYLVQKVFFGPLRNPANEHIPDLNGRELAAVVPLILAAVGMGLFPQPFLDRINPSAVAFATRTSMGGRQSQQTARANPIEVQPGEGAVRPGGQPTFRPNGAMAPRFVLPHGVQPALAAPSPAPAPAAQPE